MPLSLAKFMSTCPPFPGALLTKVYGEKIPLKDIIISETKRLHAAGILNIYSDDLYTSLSLDDIKTRFQRMGEKVQKDDTEETLRNKLKSLERTRNNSSSYYSLLHFFLAPCLRTLPSLGVGIETREFSALFFDLLILCNMSLPLTFMCI
jgi:hypothetical protein